MSEDYTFGDSLNYPFRPDDALKTIIIGTLMPVLAGVISFVASLLSIIFIGFLLYPFVIVPGLFIRGYEVAVYRSVFAGLADPPEFDDWRELGIDGLKAFGIDLVLTIPAVVIGIGGFIVAAFTGAAAGAADAGSAGGLLSSGIVIAIVLFVFVYSLLVAYVRPAAISNMILEGDFTAAFSPSALRRLSFNGTYFVGWLVGNVVIIAGALFGGLLTIILIGFAIIFVARVVGTHAFAMSIKRADDVEPDPDYAPEHRREEARRAIEGTAAGSGAAAGTGATDWGTDTDPASDDETDSSGTEDATEDTDDGWNGDGDGGGDADDADHGWNAEDDDGDPDDPDDDWNRDDDDQDEYW